jgi:hypothetical protein
MRNNARDTRAKAKQGAKQARRQQAHDESSGEQRPQLSSSATVVFTSGHDIWKRVGMHTDTANLRTLSDLPALLAQQKISVVLP